MPTMDSMSSCKSRDHEKNKCYQDNILFIFYTCIQKWTKSDVPINVWTCKLIHCKMLSYAVRFTLTWCGDHLNQGSTTIRNNETLNSSFFHPIIGLLSLSRADCRLSFLSSVKHLMSVPRSWHLGENRQPKINRIDENTSEHHNLHSSTLFVNCKAFHWAVNTILFAVHCLFHIFLVQMNHESWLEMLGSSILFSCSLHACSWWLNI